MVPFISYFFFTYLFNDTLMIKSNAGVVPDSWDKSTRDGGRVVRVENPHSKELTIRFIIYQNSSFL